MEPLWYRAVQSRITLQRFRDGKAKFPITLIATAIALQFYSVYRNAFESAFTGLGAQKLLAPAFVLARPPLAILPA